MGEPRTHPCGLPGAPGTSGGWVRGEDPVKQITNEQEFEPDRIDKEFRINHTILADPLDQAQIDESYARGGALTPNDLRANLGLDPFPEEYPFADKPLAVALLEMQLGLGPGTAPTKSAEVLLDRLRETRKQLRARVEQHGRATRRA